MSLWEDIKEGAGDVGDWLYEQARKGPPGSMGRQSDVDRAAWERGAEALVTGNAGNFVEKDAKGGGFVKTVVDELEAEGDKLLYDYSRSETSAAVDKGLAVAEVKLEEAKSAAAAGISRAGTVLEFLTRPWVLLVVGGVVVAAIAAPYVTPFLRKS